MAELRAVLPGHTIVRVGGSEPLAFLDATTTQAVATLQPGHGALACLLDERGHVLSEFRVLPLRDGTVLLDGEPAAREALVGWLARVAPLSGCEVTEESAEWRLEAIRGGARADEHRIEERDGEIAIGVRWGGNGIDVLRRGGPGGGTDQDAIEEMRIADGRPRFGIDVTPDLIVNETPLVERAVSHLKGCYPGQETVAKIRNLGRPRRLLAGARSRVRLAPGDAVVDGEREVGRVTSAAGTAAIAIVRAEALDAECTARGEAIELRALR